MMFGIAAAVNIKPGPGKIDVSFRLRSRRVVDYQSGFVFERNHSVDVIDRGRTVSPGVTAVLRNVNDHSVLRAPGPCEPNAVERQVHVIRNAVMAENNYVVALHKI